MFSTSNNIITNNEFRKNQFTPNPSCFFRNKKIKLPFLLTEIKPNKNEIKNLHRTTACMRFHFVPPIFSFAPLRKTSHTRERCADIALLCRHNGRRLSPPVALRRKATSHNSRLSKIKTVDYYVCVDGFYFRQPPAVIRNFAKQIILTS
jgi:hypothetical protein